MFLRVSGDDLVTESVSASSGLGERFKKTDEEKVTSRDCEGSPTGL